MLELRYTKPALKAIRKAPQNVSRRIRRELEVISRDPSAYRGDWQPLTNSSFWRLRVGNWRAICEIREQELVLLVLKIGSRGDVYK